jgi:hypothetical protein
MVISGVAVIRSREFLFVANRDGLYRMADTYDRLADDAEERLTSTGFRARRDAG